MRIEMTGIRDRDVIRVAEFMDARLEEKKALIEQGDWKHHRHLTVEELAAGLQRNVQELEALARRGASADEALKQIADTANWAVFLGERAVEVQIAAAKVKEVCGDDA